MKGTDLLIDAIGKIKDEYTVDACLPKRRIGRKSIKWLGLAVAAVICIAVPLPAATALGMDEAYRFLYMMSPKIAQTFKPVELTCESNGIKMTVISQKINEDEGSFYISMQGDMLDETVDLFDSYYINCPYDSVGHVSLSEFDEETKTAYFVVNVKTMNGEKIPHDKLTFGVRELIFGKCDYEGFIEDVDLSDIPKDPPTMQNVNGRGWGGYRVNDEFDYNSLSYLIPCETPLAEPVDGVTVTGIGFVDGALHIQVCYEDILHTDNHGFIEVVDRNGKKIFSEEDSHYMNVSFWDEEGVNSYDEIIIPTDYDDLGDYVLYGEFLTSSDYKSGDWEVTFPVK